jgi:dTDP-4-amino-4,6-dideoxygalactose transaminase
VFGTSHDQLASGMARGFAGPDFFTRIRKQPSLPLLRLMNGKLARYQTSATNLRAEHGRFLVDALGPDVAVLGSEMKRQTWWVFPLLVDNPAELVPQLWDGGFDASNSCSLVAIFDREDSVARFILRHIVFLPLHTDMPKTELTRMAEIVRRSGARKPAFLAASRASAARAAAPAWSGNGAAHSPAGQPVPAPRPVIPAAADAPLSG